MSRNNGERFTEILTYAIGEFFSTPNSSFLQLPNGMILQKIVEDITDNRELTINLPTKFPNRLLCIDKLCDCQFTIKEQSSERVFINIDSIKSQKLELMVIGY